MDPITAFFVMAFLITFMWVWVGVLDFPGWLGAILAVPAFYLAASFIPGPIFAIAATLGFAAAIKMLFDSHGTRALLVLPALAIAPFVALFAGFIVFAIIFYIVAFILAFVIS